MGVVVCALRLCICDCDSVSADLSVGVSVCNGTSVCLSVPMSVGNLVWSWV